jgi:hypothetical protein
MNAMILLAQGAMNMADSLATANPVGGKRSRNEYA